MTPTNPTPPLDHDKFIVPDSPKPVPPPTQPAPPRRLNAHKRESWCRHYRGLMDHDACEAGVTYASIRQIHPQGDIPCWNPELTTCAKRASWTPEEIAAREAAAKASFERIVKCLNAIHEKHGKARGMRANMPCPACGTGTLHYSIASYNGHVHGKCTTEGCASWMQ